MGVTYKLTQEVIDFILVEKKANPSLGCRSLGELVLEKFQMEVSKSSVNNVLKYSQLSSPVGRRPLQTTKPAKFAIPEDKRAQIFPETRPEPVAEQAVTPASPGPFDEEVFGQPLILEEKEIDLSQLGKVEIQESISSRKVATPPKTWGAPVEKKETLPRLPRKKVTRKIIPPAEDIPHKKEHPDYQPSRRVVDRSILYDCAGAYFLMGANWELTSRSILGAALRRYQTGEVRKEIEVLGDVLLLMEVFGISGIENLRRYNKPGLWTICGAKEEIKADDIVRSLEAVADLRDFYLRFDNEKYQIFKEASQIKINLENGGEFFIDAQMNSIWQNSSQVSFKCPINKIIINISERLITNIQPAIIRLIPGKNEFSPLILDFWAAFEAVPGRRMANICIVDQNQEELARFTSLPNIKRRFLIGANARQKDFDQLMARKENILTPVHIEELGRTVYYTGKTDYLAQVKQEGNALSLRVLFVSPRENTPADCAIFTNIPDEDASAQEIIRGYFSRWPNGLAFDAAGSASKDPLSEAPKNKSRRLERSRDIWDMKKELLADLDAYCRRRFFPVFYKDTDLAIMRERFYGLNGYIKRANGVLAVYLALPENYAYRDELIFAINRLNESDIRDYSGFRLKVFLDSQLKDEKPPAHKLDWQSSSGPQERPLTGMPVGERLLYPDGVERILKDIPVPSEAVPGSSPQISEASERPTPHSAGYEDLTPESMRKLDEILKEIKLGTNQPALPLSSEGEELIKTMDGKLDAMGDKISQRIAILLGELKNSVGPARDAKIRELNEIAGPEVIDISKLFNEKVVSNLQEFGIEEKQSQGVDKSLEKLRRMRKGG